MPRKTVQLLVLISVFLLVGMVLWYQYQQGQELQTRVLPQYGYGYFVSRTVVNGLEQLSFTGETNKPFTLDALEVPQSVTSLSTPVQWVQIPYTANPSGYGANLLGNNANRIKTSFTAPSTEGFLIFELRVRSSAGSPFQPVARYVVRVLTPLSHSADLNDDGRFTWKADILPLLQNWNSYGANAQQMLDAALQHYDAS